MNKLIKMSYENQICIDMIYQSNEGKFTQRIIKVLQIEQDHIKAYCYFRKAERRFRISNILSVATLRSRKRGA